MDTITNRTCATCACHIIQASPINPLHKQSFCRRAPPIHAVGQVEVPRIKDGQAVISRDGKPIMNTEQRDFYLYPPTQPELLCFDGWRHLGTLPGDRDDAVNLSMKVMQKLYDDIINPPLVDAKLDG